MAHDNGAIVTVTTLAVVAGTSIIAWILYKKFYASSPSPSKPEGSKKVRIWKDAKLKNL